MPGTVSVVLAGGRGTRLWPLSTHERPKHLLTVDGRPLVAHAVERLLPLCAVSVLTAPDLLEATVAATPGTPVLVEPAPRGTGAAVALAVAVAERAGADVVIVAPSDHRIADPAAFREAIESLIARRSERAGVVGIPASSPEAGFGWIEAPPGEGVRPVSRFVEKPDPDTAAALLAAGASWNSGVFVVPVAAAPALERRLPGALAAARAWLSGDAAPWTALPPTSFDRAFLEHEPSDMVTCACGWSDLGTLERFAETWPEVPFRNRVHATSVRAVDAMGCRVWAPDRAVELVGVTDVVVVDANGILLVAAREP